MARIILLLNPITVMQALSFLMLLDIIVLQWALMWCRIFSFPTKVTSNHYSPQLLHLAPQDTFAPLTSNTIFKQHYSSFLHFTPLHFKCGFEFFQGTICLVKVQVISIVFFLQVLPLKVVYFCSFSVYCLVGISSI